MGLGGGRVDQGLLGLRHKASAIGVDGLEGYGSVRDIGAFGLMLGMSQAGVANPGVQPLYATGGDDGVNAVSDAGDAVMGKGRLRRNVVVEVGVQEAISSCAAVPGEGDETNKLNKHIKKQHTITIPGVIVQ